MWRSRRKSQVNIGQVGRHRRRIIDSASVRRAYDDDQRTLRVGRSPLTPSGVVYSVFKNKMPNQDPRCWWAQLLRSSTFKNCAAPCATKLPPCIAVVKIEAALILHMLSIAILLGYLLHLIVCLQLTIIHGSGPFRKNDHLPRVCRRPPTVPYASFSLTSPCPLAQVSSSYASHTPP